MSISSSLFVDILDTGICPLLFIPLNQLLGTFLGTRVSKIPHLNPSLLTVPDDCPVLTVADAVVLYPDHIRIPDDLRIKRKIPRVNKLHRWQHRFDGLQEGIVPAEDHRAFTSTVWVADLPLRLFQPFRIFIFPVENQRPQVSEFPVFHT